MITTNTGAKKIEGTDNWRQIFDAHNSSVDAHDETQSDLDYIIKGNSSSVSIAAGKFVSVRGSTITGVTDGIYTAAKAIPASTTLDSSYFTAVTGGALNALSDHLANQIIIRTNTVSNSFQFNVGNNDVDYSSYPIFQIPGYTMVLAIGIAYSGYINCTNFTATRVAYQASGSVQLPCQAICIYTKN